MTIRCVTEHEYDKIQDAHYKSENLEKLVEIIEVQQKSGNYDATQYQYGLLVGLELAYSTLCDIDFMPTKRPEKFLEDE